ncbi:hypothetical protein HPB50_018538 [Hyalomma asiaticum]|uniref:Uncharacterized protein n=1 Tax=Hyalomma asiaticum TaxID=266040 RepID=A0ACB7TJZ7_HYAAI|nr:hypothetical protein HPB50_018538 [Hyalomma asiaticum]
MAHARDISWDSPAAAGAYLPRSAAAASSTPADPTPQSPPTNKQPTRHTRLKTKLASFDGGRPSLVLRRPGYAIRCLTSLGCGPCSLVEGSGTTTSMVRTLLTTTTTQSNFRDWPGGRWCAAVRPTENAGCSLSRVSSLSVLVCSPADEERRPLRESPLATGGGGL